METQDYDLSMGLLFDSSVQVSRQPSQRLSIPYVSLLSDRIVLYHQPECTMPRRCPLKASISNLAKNKPSGKITPHTKGRIRKIIDTWLSAIYVYNKSYENEHLQREHYPIFITLTLCSEQKHPDEYIKRTMLTQFIQKLQTNHDIKNLFWRAEKQKNGNIHFHIITDKYIPKSKLSKYWADLLEKEGYLKSYQEKFGNKQPPSVNVEGADSIKNFIEYVTKYATKESPAETVAGRIYGMTDNLRKIQPFTTCQDNQISEDINQIIYENRPKYFDMEFAGVYLLIGKKMLDFSSKALIKQYRMYLMDVYDSLYYENSDMGTIDLINGDIVTNDLKAHYYEQLSFYDICPSFCPIVQAKTFESDWW
jgi:hypothetical protein